MYEIKDGTLLFAFSNYIFNELAKGKLSRN